MANDSRQKIMEFFSLVRNDMRDMIRRTAILSGRFSHMEERKKSLLRELEEFLKTDETIVIARLEDKSRIEISPYGLKKIACGRRARGTSLSITEQVDILNPDNRKLCSVVNKSGSLKLRIDCFLKAIEMLPELSTVHAKCKELSEQRTIYSKGKIQHFSFRDLTASFTANLQADENDDTKIEDEDFNQDIIKFAKIKILSGRFKFIEKKDDEDGTELKIADINDYLAIEQVKDILDKRINELLISSEALEKEYSDVVDRMREQFAPVLALEAI